MQKACKDTQETKYGCIKATQVIVFMSDNQEEMYNVL